MYEVKAYRCSYCRKYSTSKSLIKKHDAICFKNPASKSCITCNNFTEDNNYEFKCTKGIAFNKRGDKTILETNCHRWTLDVQLEEEYGEDAQ